MSRFTNLFSEPSPAVEPTPVVEPTPEPVKIQNVAAEKPVIENREIKK